MPIPALWTFIGSLVLLALGLTYKWVENAHGLKLSEKEADRLRTALDTLEETRKNESLSFRAEIDALNCAHNKKISDIQELHQRETDELRKEIANLSHQEVPPKETFIEAGGVKWKVQYSKDKIVDINKIPYCKGHGLKFVLIDDTYKCPYCTVGEINDYLLDDLLTVAESIIEKVIKDIHNETT